MTDTPSSPAQVNRSASERRAARQANRMGGYVADAEDARDTFPSPATLDLGEPADMGDKVVEAEEARLQAASDAGPTPLALAAAEAQATNPDPAPPPPVKKAPAKKAAAPTTTAREG